MGHSGRMIAYGRYLAFALPLVLGCQASCRSASQGSATSSAATSPGTVSPPSAPSPGAPPRATAPAPTVASTPTPAPGPKPRPQTKQACDACGGLWDKHGIAETEGCICKTKDGGKVCRDGAECEGQCLV